MVTPNWMTTDFIIKEPVLGGASIAAVNEQGEILAVRLGCVRNRDQWAMALGDKIVCRLLAWRPLYRLVPASSSLKHCWIYMKLLLDAIDYNVWKQFDKLGCDRIYEVWTHLVCLRSI